MSGLKRFKRSPTRTEGEGRLWIGIVWSTEDAVKMRFGIGTLSGVVHLCKDAQSSDTSTSGGKMAYAEGEPGGFWSQYKDLRCGCGLQGGLGTVSGQGNAANHHLPGESIESFEIVETGMRGDLTSRITLLLCAHSAQSPPANHKSCE